MKYDWACKVDFVKELKELQRKIKRSMCQGPGPWKRGQILMQLQMAIMTKNEETQSNLYSSGHWRRKFGASNSDRSPVSVPLVPGAPAAAADGEGGGGGTDSSLTRVSEMR